MPGQVILLSARFWSKTWPRLLNINTEKPLCSGVAEVWIVAFGLVPRGWSLLSIRTTSSVFLEMAIVVVAFICLLVIKIFYLEKVSLASYLSILAISLA
jgi:hypothetical protein